MFYIKIYRECRIWEVNEIEIKVLDKIIIFDNSKDIIKLINSDIEVEEMEVFINYKRYRIYNLFFNEYLDCYIVGSNNIIKGENNDK